MSEEEASLWQKKSDITCGITFGVCVCVCCVCVCVCVSGKERGEERKRRKERIEDEGVAEMAKAGGWELLP